MEVERCPKATIQRRSARIAGKPPKPAATTEIPTVRQRTKRRNPRLVIAAPPTHLTPPPMKAIPTDMGFTVYSPFPLRMNAGNSPLLSPKAMQIKWLHRQEAKQRARGNPVVARTARKASEQKANGNHAKKTACKSVSGPLLMEDAEFQKGKQQTQPNSCGPLLSKHSNTAVSQ